jgi:hypothetical protein
MSIFNFLNTFKKKPIEVASDISVEDPIVDPIVEDSEPTQEEEESRIEDVPETPVETILEEPQPEIESVEIPELPSEDTEIIPADEVIDKLRSKYQTYDLTLFLDFDYALEGERDGYNIHSSEFLKKKKQYLTSEFQRLIEKRVDELKDERLSCKNLIIDMRGLSDQLVEKFELRVDLCNEYIEDLHNEKVLSNSGSGLIRSVLTDYEVGWDRGISDYLMDNHFLNPLKRL